MISDMTYCGVTISLSILFSGYMVWTVLNYILDELRAKREQGK